MSLFPAYNQSSNECQQSHEDSSQWLENASFPVEAIQVAPVTRSKKEELDSDIHTSSSSSDNDENTSSSQESQKRLKLSDKKRKRKNTPEKKPPSPLLDFSGNEDFYVDKTRAKQYHAVKTLHKPACPKYRKHYGILGRNYSSRSDGNKTKRYYRYNRFGPDEEQSRDQKCYPLTENEYTELMGELNRKTMENCRETKNWLDLIALQDRNPYKWSKLRVAEKKIDYIEKALNFHPSNDDLYRVYIATITQCYTSHDVSKMLDTYLSKDPYNLSLWQAQIMCTQGTMARCTVPDVLRIYERCMKKIFNTQKPATASCDQVNDSIMMHLFYTLSLFLRQAGLYEQFFALIKLALELNVPANTAILEDLQPRPQDEQILVEYEELILQSGLPMNEIWLRIEKLRQGYFFLPFPGDSAKCSDPQRIVFNEDVCHYVYPMKSKENSFKLLLIIVKLLKLPLIHTHCMAVQMQGDTDAIEDLLVLYLNPNYNWSSDHMEFFASLYEFSKEMASSPTYLNHCIGHEIYSNCLQKFLINCSKAYEQIDERKRIAFLILWCRFQRLLLLVEKMNKKFNAEFAKNGKKLFKALLKHPINRNCLTLYVEFARYDHEAGTSLDALENVFQNLFEAYNQDQNLRSELAYAYLTFAELLLKSQDNERVSQIISAYALDCNISKDISNARKLVALNVIKENVERLVNIEENVHIMLLEQYIIPDDTLSHIKLYCLLLFALKQKQQALECIQKLLTRFNTVGNERHQYLREQLYETYISLMQLPGGNSYISYSLVQQTIEKALRDYPENLFLLQKWGSQASLPWYKLRKGYTTIGTSIKCVIFLISLARCRFLHNIMSESKVNDLNKLVNCTDLHHHEMLVRQRILNLFKMLIISNTSSTSPEIQPLQSIRRNSLFWRCYLRCLSDQSCSFDLSKQCLLTALDECPWSKALYLDGATYVPQELSHLQDLIIEKQLRIYALPEELEILRQR
ncbi:nuclear exosome regulator NRDE2 [Haematobia irritans]|uniref:nuclear exosome regulator NRDE2 n=1 Tax=Haematobia irritans TaxID=7368 RepID=UPI003F506C7C